MLTDVECIKKSVEGDSNAFGMLVSRYQEKVGRLVFKHVRNQETARDLCQDIFLKVFVKLKYFKGDSKFSSWLYRIAVNEAIDYIRANRKKVEDSLEHAYEHGFEVRDTSPQSDIHRTHEKNMETLHVQKSLFSLSPEMRSIIVLKVYEEKTFDEIADILQIPLSTVKSRLYKALETLGRNYRRRTMIREVK
jgi:RNA polymerase sigma-70 factor (ECF subfamily)